MSNLDGIIDILYDFPADAEEKMHKSFLLERPFERFDELVAPGFGLVFHFEVFLPLRGDLIVTQGSGCETSCGSSNASRSVEYRYLWVAN